MREYAEKILKDVVKKLYNEEAYLRHIIVEETDEQHGEYAANIALVLAAKEKSNPRFIADKISGAANEISKSATFTVAGPGFINVRFSDEYLVNRLLDKELNLPQPKAGKRVVFEFSDPNPFKQLHAGHLYTSIVGDAMARLYEALGADVARVNFGGDVGRHVAISIYGMMKWCGGELNYEKISTIEKSQRPTWLSEVYVLGNSLFEESPDVQQIVKDINKNIYAIHSQSDKDSLLSRVYFLTRQWSYDYFQEFYDSLGLQFDKYYPESQTAKKGHSVVLEQHQKGVYEESEGGGQSA